MQSRFRNLIYVLVTLTAVTGAYSNHFRNGFHFDDTHTVTD